MSTPEAGGRVAGTQTVARAFAVLRLFRDHRGDLGVGAVARELGLNLSTTHRIVRALVAEGYLAQNEDNEHYYLGAGALLLGQAAQHNFGLDVVYPVLQRLAEQTGESVNLGVLSGSTEVVVVERVESAQPLRFTQPPGTRIALHASSMGKALLANNSDAEHQTLHGTPRLTKVTEKTYATAKALRAELDTIRARGWSTDDEESVLGVRCAGAPILDSAGRARAAVAVQAPAVRVPDERFAELGPLVAAAAKEIATLLPPGHSF
ncbi:IclR family transcriptional regulator [Sciscionella marina]|uniref:IclR family transcriptional regulator n=1 Tax=Sciscionella marina TaxID=508770 RepID=UPI0003616673|nr:IclR family transcriptional regulator [Sciscionella marina]